MDRLESFPTSPTLFDGTRQEQFLATAIETTIQDVSLDGDQERARELGAYMLGSGAPPANTPQFVSIRDGTITIDNPPYLTGTATITAEGGIDLALDSELDLLLDPPVEIAVSGPLEDAVETTEELLARIYSTRGRYLEQIDAGVEDPTS